MQRGVLALELAAYDKDEDVWQVPRATKHKHTGLECNARGGSGREHGEHNASKAYS